MKVTLEYKLPEEKSNYLNAISGSEYRKALEEVRDTINKLDETVSGSMESMVIHHVRDQILECFKKLDI